MITHSVRINLNNIKKHINKQYFKYRDIFYRILLINLCINREFNNTTLSNTIIEDAGYNQYFLYLINKQLSLKELLSELNIENELPLYIDLSLYIDEFIKLKHYNEYLNIYSVTITDDGHLVIYNKKIDKENLTNA